jgi:sulfoxide reductase heme-binding subunit YedZ
MTRRWVIAKVFVWIGCLAPLAWLVARLFGVGGTSLGANPVETILDTCGKTALNLLVFTLCITPIRRSTGVNRLVTLRRLLGLFAFFYVVVHVLTYAWLDLRLAWGTLLVDVTERPYITVGFLALVMLIPLAVTSTNGWQRRLGRRWVKLHRLVYPIAILGVVHFWWQVKLDTAEPWLYAFVLAVLLGVRVQHALELRTKRRAASVHAKTAVPAANQRVQRP